MLLLLFLPPLRGDASKQPEKKKYQTSYLLARPLRLTPGEASSLLQTLRHWLLVCPVAVPAIMFTSRQRTIPGTGDFPALMRLCCCFLPTTTLCLWGNSEEAKESFSLLFVVAETQFFVYCSRLFELHAWPGDYISGSNYAKRQHRARLAVRFACYVTRRPRPCNGAFLI